MSNPTTSLVAVSAKEALRAVPHVLKAAQLKKDQERESHIKNLCRYRRVKTGWFRSRSMTRKEAEDIVDGPRWQNDRFVPETGWRLTLGNETLANQIASAAALTQDGFIWLNLEQADWLHSWLDRAKGAP